MTLKDIKKLTKGEKAISKADLESAILFFGADAEGACECVEDFVKLSFIIGRTEDNSFLDDIHLVSQKYIAAISRKPDLKKKHMAYLYLRELEYYSIVNSYSECIRIINEVMEIDDVPDFCFSACLSMAIEIFMGCGLTKEAEKYVEAMRAFSNICDLPPRVLIMLDCNLMQAYALMGKRKEYEYYKNSTTKYPRSALDEGVISIVKLYVLGAQAVIDADKKPSFEYVRGFCELMEKGSFNMGPTANLAEMMAPAVRWVKDYVPLVKLIDYVLAMINYSTVVADRVELYKILVDDLKLDKSKYSDIYEGYYHSLRAFYDNDCETRRHEVVGEMLSYEIEKQYKKSAFKDELTGIGNRHAYEAELADIKGECENGRLPDDVTVFSLDVNGLKHVNDTFGHQAGDDYIKGGAASLEKAIGSYGNIYRVGGDEFAAIVRIKQFPVERIIEVLRQHLSEWSDSYGNQLTMSVGYASSYDNPGCNLEELISFADEGMYKDKRLFYQQSGRDRRQR